ncbi:MAG: SDR family NAD(P)-dependent oxidoreductase [Methanothrix sp.]|nr:SDR family NAD(P)-dependent oxidoreductase [Methanothrix sp.]
MDLNLLNKRALITGGSKGIGLAIKKALEKEGVKVISWSRSEGVDLMEDIPDIFPEIDILINNIGGMGTSNFDDSDECMYKNYGIMKTLIDKFISYHKKEGRVITISSMYGKEKGICPWFTAAKAAQIAYMKSMSNKFKGITFNTICPGYIDTGKITIKDCKNHIVGEPEDIANIVTFLCSNLAKHINGACITVDGGESYSF